MLQRGWRKIPVSVPPNRLNLSLLYINFPLWLLNQHLCMTSQYFEPGIEGTAGCIQFYNFGTTETISLGFRDFHSVTVGFLRCLAFNIFHHRVEMSPEEACRVTIRPVSHNNLMQDDTKSLFFYGIQENSTIVFSYWYNTVEGGGGPPKRRAGKISAPTAAICNT